MPVCYGSQATAFGGPSYSYQSSDGYEYPTTSHHHMTSTGFRQPDPIVSSDSEDSYYAEESFDDDGQQSDGNHGASIHYALAEVKGLEIAQGILEAQTLLAACNLDKGDFSTSQTTG